MGRLRVLVADDQPIVLEGLRSILTPEFEIVGEARDGKELLAAARRTKCDMIVTDIAMPLLNGIEAVRRIKKTDPNVKVVFLTMHADMVYATEALKAGGSAFVLKSSAGDELLTAIYEVLRGRKFVTTAIAARVLEAMASRGARGKRGIECLTRRQREVLKMVAQGKTLSQVAETLHISTSTVKSHKRRLMEELQLHTTAGLTRYAIEHDLLEHGHGADC
jgi:DNA-binding NarL/FixJ family response regulator